MLGTPTLFQVPTVEYLMSLIRTMNLLMQQGHYLDTCFVGGDAFVSKARNGIVQSFIESWATPYPVDVLLFIDDDQSQIVKDDIFTDEAMGANDNIYVSGG